MAHSIVEVGLHEGNSLGRNAPGHGDNLVSPGRQHDRRTNMIDTNPDNKAVQNNLKSLNRQV